MTSGTEPPSGAIPIDATARGWSPSPLQRPPRVWTVFVAYVLALVAALGVQVVVGLAIVAWQVAQGRDVQQVAEGLPELITRPPIFIALLAASQLAIGLCALVGARLSVEPSRARLGWHPPGVGWHGYVLAAVASLLPLEIGVALAHQLAKVLTPDPTARLLYEKMTPAWALPYVLFIALAPGFMEELLFRGYMQRRLLQRWSPAVAIGVTSLLFALMHGAPHAILAAGPLGVWFGIVAWRTGSVWPGIACHAFVNGAWNAWNLGAKFAGLPDVTHPVIAVTASALGATSFVASLYMLRSHAHVQAQSAAP